jgi:hypothetical protein
LIINNTIVEPQNGVAIDINEPRLLSTIKDGEIVLERVDHENTVIANNIILYTKATIESDLANVVTTAGLDFHHNLWWASPYLGPPANVNDRDTDIIENPKLHDPDHIREGGLVNPNWYELSANSPAINAAKYFAEVTIDFYWNQRSNPPDMGAHEFGGNLPPTTPE